MLKTSDWQFLKFVFDALARVGMVFISKTLLEMIITRREHIKKQREHSVKQKEQDLQKQLIVMQQFTDKQLYDKEKFTRPFKELPMLSKLTKDKSLKTLLLVPMVFQTLLVLKRKTPVLKRKDNRLYRLLL